MLSLSYTDLGDPYEPLYEEELRSRSGATVTRDTSLSAAHSTPPSSFTGGKLCSESSPEKADIALLDDVDDRCDVWYSGHSIFVLSSGHTGWSYAPEVQGFTMGAGPIEHGPFQAWWGCGEGENIILSADVGKGCEYWYRPSPSTRCRDGSVSLWAGEGYAGECNNEAELGACWSGDTGPR